MAKCCQPGDSREAGGFPISVLYPLSPTPAVAIVSGKEQLQATGKLTLHCDAVFFFFVFLGLID